MCKKILIELPRSTVEGLLKDMHEVKKGMYDLEKDVECIQRKARVLSLYAENLEERFQEVLNIPPAEENARI